MKPYSLKITGINSFNKTQKINFNELFNDGIFGIFGDTGAGKSTIIDCITLSLYGKIVRYNGKRGNGDFLNLNRNNGQVEFIFSIKEGDNEIFYEVIRRFKRTNDGKIKTDLCRFSILENNDKKILIDKSSELDKKIVDIIGLDYDDFTKAVVLPQGKFSDFLLLENSDKTTMLQRIFGLEKYGDKLKDSLKIKRDEKQYIVDNLKKDLEKYGDISIESIENYEKQLETEKFKLLETEKQQNLIEKKQKFYEEVKSKVEKYRFYLEKLNELKSFESTFEKFKKNLELIKESYKIAPILIEKNNLEQEINKLNSEIYSLSESIEHNLHNYKNAQQNYNLAYEKKEKEKPKLDKLKLELENCVKLLDEKTEKQKIIDNINLKMENLHNKKQAYFKEQDEIEQNLQKSKLDLEKISLFNEQNKIDEKFKQSISNAMEFEKQKESLQNSINSLNCDIDEHKNKLDDFRQVETSLKESCQNILKDINLFLNSNVKNYKNNLQNILKQKDDLNKQLQTILDSIKDVSTQIKLQENKDVVNNLIKQLKSGEACPVCGSLNHPSPAKIFMDSIITTLNEQHDNLQVQKDDIESKLKNIDLKESILINSINNLEDISINYDVKNTEIFEKYLVDEKYVLKYLRNYEAKLEQKNIKLNEILTNVKSIETLLNSQFENKKVQEDNLSEVLKCLDDYKFKLNVDNFTDEHKKIVDIEKQIFENTNKYTKITQNITDLTNNLQEIKTKINDINLQEENLKTNKNLTLEIIFKIDEEIKKFSSDKEPNFYLEEVLYEINKIVEDEQQYKMQFENIKLQKEKLENDLNVKKGILNTNNCSISKKQNDIKEYMKNGIFESEDMIIEIYNSREKNEQRYLKKINSYNEKFLDYENNIKRLKDEFDNIEKNFEIENDINCVDENLLINILNKINMQKDEMNINYKRLVESVAYLQIELKNNKLNLEKIKELNSKLLIEQKYLDILKEISDVTKGGEFIKYIANSQLKYIVYDASNRLLNMTNNKYCLELLDGDFVIKDNYNGGLIRNARSLSGGELFMASLSLAISLSSKIQLRNKSPLEIFFLDEGFGTLDNNTLDTVINTLEQLQTNNITVGIITHVEEIKNRLQNKIYVENSNDGAKIVM